MSYTGNQVGSPDLIRRSWTYTSAESIPTYALDNGTQLLTGISDPTIGPIPAVEGSLYLRTQNGNGSAYIMAGGVWQLLGAGSPGSTFVVGETPSGTVPGTSFTLAHSPVSGSVSLYRNGIRLSVTTDYTISVGSITTVQTIQSSDQFLADYRY